MNTHVARDETRALIAASKVEGTACYDPDGEKIGSIAEIMIDKRTGEVAYAVMSFGGFLGIGEKYHPLPWDALDYDETIGGYRVGMAGEGFRDAPAYDSAALEGFDARRPDIDRWYDDAARDGRIRRNLTEPSAPLAVATGAGSSVIAGDRTPKSNAGIGQSGMVGGDRHG
ncbi:MAG: PRC-barrel domain-containing protein [Sphingomonadaceae bacterium]